ncbi:MAG: hypothetical protein FJ398_02735 [Verrucomicrobia bacterium]|nr:hypothetical protein [Verrucomicrobiota bacterium]
MKTGFTILVMIGANLTSALGFTELREHFNSLDRWDLTVSGTALNVKVYDTGGGLSLLTSSFPGMLGAEQRHDIRTHSSDFSWLTADNQPVTYSFTIRRFPPPTKDNMRRTSFL